MSSIENFPCQCADVSPSKHPKRRKCGCIHRLDGDFLLKEQRNIYFLSFLQLMEDILSGPLGRSAVQQNKKYFNHFNRSEPFNLDRLMSSIENFPCQCADVSPSKHPKRRKCGCIHRLDGDFLLKEQRNIYFLSFLQLMEDILSGPLGRSAVQHVELELSIEIVHAQIHHLRTMENHATELVTKHKDVTTLTPA